MKLDLENIKEGLTQSEITTWDECAQRWFYGYNQMLKPRNSFNWYFVYGDAFHRTISDFYAGQEKVASLQFPAGVVLTGEQEAERDRWQAVLEVQMQRYFRYYADDHKAWDIHLNEEIVTVDFEGFRFTGKIDLGYSLKGDSNLIHVDHKSYGRYDKATYEGWFFRFQFMFYLWLVRRKTGRDVSLFMVNGLKKPGLKQGVNENVAQYTARVQQDMIQRPEEYFKRTPLAVMPNLIERFEENVLRPKISRLKLLTKGKPSAMLLESLTRNKNTSACTGMGSVCPFMPLCSVGESELYLYDRRETKHVELAE